MEIQHRILVEIYTENPMQEMWLYASDLETTLGVKELLKTLISPKQRLF